MQPICRQQYSAANIFVTRPLPQVGSEDGMSEYGDTERAGEEGVSIWQELQDETIRLESRKSSSSSQVSINIYLVNSLGYTSVCQKNPQHTRTGSNCLFIRIWRETKEGSLYNNNITQIFSYNLQASTDSLDSAEDFTPVEINLGEIKEMLSMYRSKRRVSTSALGTNK